MNAGQNACSAGEWRVEEREDGGMREGKGGLKWRGGYTSFIFFGLKKGRGDKECRKGGRIKKIKEERRGEWKGWAEEGRLRGIRREKIMEKKGRRKEESEKRERETEGRREVIREGKRDNKKKWE